jgi:hypothetical protein
MPIMTEEQVSPRREKIIQIRGTAKDDDSGGWPFYETPCFDSKEEALIWANMAQEKGYNYIRVDVTISVEFNERGGGWGYYTRSESPFIYDANIRTDAEYYAKLKGYGQLEDGFWIVIRNRKILCYSKNEKEALEAACRETGRCLVRCAWHETENDEMDVLAIRKRASLLKC